MLVCIDEMPFQSSLVPVVKLLYQEGSQEQGLTRQEAVQLWQMHYFGSSLGHVCPLSPTLVPWEVS